MDLWVLLWTQLALSTFPELIGWAIFIAFEISKSINLRLNFAQIKALYSFLIFRYTVFSHTFTRLWSTSRLVAFTASWLVLLWLWCSTLTTTLAILLYESRWHSINFLELSLRLILNFKQSFFNLLVLVFQFWIFCFWSFLLAFMRVWFCWSRKWWGWIWLIWPAISFPQLTKLALLVRQVLTKKERSWMIWLFIRIIIDWGVRNWAIIRVKVKILSYRLLKLQVISLLSIYCYITLPYHNIIVSALRSSIASRNTKFR